MAYDNIKTALKKIGFSSELIDLFFESDIAKENSTDYNFINSKISTSFGEIKKDFFSLVSLLVGFSLSEQSGERLDSRVSDSVFLRLNLKIEHISQADDCRFYFDKIADDYFISKQFSLYNPILKSRRQSSDLAAVNPSLRDHVCAASDAVSAASKTPRPREALDQSPAAIPVESVIAPTAALPTTVAASSVRRPTLTSFARPRPFSLQFRYDQLKSALKKIGFFEELIDLFFIENPDSRHSWVNDQILNGYHFCDFKSQLFFIVSALVGFSFALQHRRIRQECSGKAVADATYTILNHNHNSINFYGDFFNGGLREINKTNFAPKEMNIYTSYSDFAQSESSDDEGEEAGLAAPVDDRAIAQPAVSAAQSQVAIPAAKPVAAETPSLAKVASCSVASPLTSVAMLNATPSAGDAEVPANAGDQVFDAAGSSLAPHYEGFFTGLPPEMLNTEKSLRYWTIEQCNFIIADLEKEINSRSKLSKFFSFAPDLRPLHIQALEIFVDLLKKHILTPVESLDLIVKSYPAFGSEKRIQRLLSGIKKDQSFAMNRHSTDEQMRAAANFVYEQNAEFVHNHGSEYSGVSLQASC